jgi:outer membrane receptor protein involved in Fe transport
MNGGYAMYDGALTDRLKLTGGVRVERYWQELKALNQATISKDDIDILPSFLLTYSLNKKTNLRLAGSQAVNRPEFRELASYSVFDYENFLVVRGNPLLERSKNTNGDLRYEYFPSSGEIVSVSAFYKYFNSPIEQINAGNDVLSYENATNATTYGAELEVRKRLDFIGGNFFDNMTFYTNLA